MLFNLAVILSLVTSYAIPGVAALLTASHLPKNVIGLLALVLAAVSGFVAQWQAGGNFIFTHALLLTLGNLIVTVVAHKQLWEGYYEDVLHSLGVGGSSTSRRQVNSAE